jgi:glutamine amidotransferase
MIAIIDYNTGNLRSLTAAFRHVGLDAVVTNDPEELWRCKSAILPGVGAFGPAMERLRGCGMDEHVRAFAETRPVLGICLGMQLLTDGSEESPGVDGLGLVSAKCYRLHSSAPVPRVGWFPIEQGENSQRFYFAHSYYVIPSAQDATAWTRFGEGEGSFKYAAMIRHNNVFGVQFHPEKSGEAGLAMLRRFGAMVEQREVAA